jgi:hypothetical protein
MKRNNSHPAEVSILILISLLLISPTAFSQDEYHVYFGNIDESPYPVPAHDTVDIPVYVSGARIGSGTITLYAWNLYISERLGGYFYLGGDYNFAIPQYYEVYSRQSLNFSPSFWEEGIFRLADFTMVMDADSSYYGEVVDALEAPTVVFGDTMGYFIIFPLVHISPLLILGMDAAEEPISQPGNFDLFSAYPNPFNSYTTIRFTLTEVSDVAIEVYDIAGRQVRSLNIPGCRAGENHTTWDGRDNGGDPVSSGTYIYRLTAGKLSNFSRVTLIK